jgi:hypothetical protein
MTAESSSSLLTMHELLAEARRRLGEDSPGYQWTHARVVSAELPATKIGPVWKLPPSSVDILENLWRTRHRRATRAA